MSRLVVSAPHNARSHSTMKRELEDGGIPAHTHAGAEHIDWYGICKDWWHREGSRRLLWVVSWFPDLYK